MLTSAVCHVGGMASKLKKQKKTQTKRRDEGTVADITALAKSVLESEKNANNLVDLLEYLQESDNVTVLRATVQAVCEVYCHLIGQHYKWLVPGVSKFGGKTVQSDATLVDDITRQYHDWMRENYVCCRERLVHLLHHDDQDVRWSSLCSLLKLIKSEGSAHQQTYHTYKFPNSTFHVIVSNLLDNKTNQKPIITQFQEYLTYDDIRFYWLKNIASVVTDSFDKSHVANISEHFVVNVYCALEVVKMPTNEEGIEQFFAGDPPELPAKEEVDSEEDEEDEQGREKPPKCKRSKQEIKSLSVRSLHKHKKQFSDAWLAFLRLPLSSVLFKKVLVSLHSKVMPHLYNPRLLLDFLTLSYDAGGVISILALNGLFILIHEYHLDYPDFYNKLYQLLEPSLFHVKYMQRFFHLLDTFLRSTHLPLYLVAAFAKKIARMALSAPPNGVMVAVVFITNLLKRHPNCKVLIHRSNLEGFELSSGEDPFIMAEPDPSQCGALDSCLWELKTLQSHYVPAVSELVRKMLDPETANSKIETELDKYLDVDFQELFEDVCTDVSSAHKVPLNFHEPTSLWSNKCV